MTFEEPPAWPFISAHPMETIGWMVKSRDETNVKDAMIVHTQIFYRCIFHSITIKAENRKTVIGLKHPSFIVYIYSFATMSRQ